MARSRADAWDQPRLAALVRELATGGSTALIVQQAGETVLSAGQVSRATSVASVRKSLISILYGLYVDEGRIDLDASLADLDIDDIPPLSQQERQARVRDLLTSRSGVYHLSVYDIDRDRPARGSHPPGSYFYYNNWDFNVLGTIFERATGVGLFSAFAERVAVPLGMEDFVPADLRFEHGPESIHPVYKMRLSARDLVRVGQLYLRKGVWNGRQLVPEAWIEESVRPHVDLGGGRGYGYLWWSAAAHAPGDRLRADVPLYYASGLGGQYIVVIPGHDLVVVHRAARVDHGIDHGRMGEILDVIVQAMPARLSRLICGRAAVMRSNLVAQLPAIAGKPRHCAVAAYCRHSSLTTRGLFLTASMPSPAPSPHVAGIREQYATRAAFLITGLSMSSWAPLVPFAKARLGVDDGTLGLLLLCLGLGSIVTMPLTGIVTSRWGCRLVISVATLLLAVVIPVLAFANSVSLLAVAIAAFGAGVGALSVSINVQAVMVENDSGRHMMSGFHGLFSVGGIIGASSVSLLIGSGLTPFTVTLVVSALLILLLVLAWSGLLPYGNRNAEETPLLVLPRGFVIFLGTLCFLVFLAEGAMLDWSAVFLISVHGLDPAQAGFGYSMFALAMTIGRFSGDWLVRTFGGTRIIMSGGLLAAAGLALAVLAPVPWLAFAGFLLVGLGISNLVPIFFTAAGRQTIMPPSFAIASITAIGYAGILLGPAGIGLVAKFSGLEMSFALVALGLLFVAVSGPRVTRG